MRLSASSNFVGLGKIGFACGICQNGFPDRIAGINIPIMSDSYINFTGTINEAVSNKFMAACAAIIGTDHPDSLHFLFSSPGGDVNCGVAIYNYLRALPLQKMVMYNTGSIDSVANVIFHAADERHSAPHSTFHFHGVAMNLSGNTPGLSHSHIRELQSQIEALETKIANILASRCQLSIAELQDLFLHGKSVDTTFALQKGVIQSVKQPVIPPNTKFYSLTF